MNRIMNMSGFSLDINGPTSTSTQIAVASRFGGPNGLLIKFDNKYYPAKFVHGFDVSWLSRYGSQEDERYQYVFYPLHVGIYIVYIFYTGYSYIVMMHSTSQQ